MSYIKKLCIVFNDSLAVYKDLEIELITSDEEEAHYLAKIDDNTGVAFCQNRNGEITGMAIRVTDPDVVRKVQDFMTTHNIKPGEEHQIG